MKRLFLISIFFSSFFARGVISYALHEHENGHCALNLGDCHDKEMDSINKKQGNAFTEFLEKCINPERPLKIYLETPKDTTVPENSCKIRNAIIIDVMKQGLKKLEGKEGLTYEFYEPRKSESSFVNGHFYRIGTLLYKNENQKIELQEFPLFKKFITQYLKNDPLTIKTYVNTLERDEQRLKKWRGRFPTSSTEYGLFDKKCSLFSQSKNKIIQEFSNQDVNQPLMLAFLEFIGQKGPDNIFERFITLYALILKESDYIVADAGFLKKFLQEKNTEQNLVFITGFDHQQALSSDFEALNYKTIASEKIGIDLGNYQIAYNFRPEFLPSILCALAYCTEIDVMQMNYFKNKLLSFVPKEEVSSLISNSNDSSKYNTKATNSRICGFCKKPEDPSKNLQRCSKCKNARYCNQECQRKAWQDHKKDCK
jgi:hypothetical protein